MLSLTDFALWFDRTGPSADVSTFPEPGDAPLDFGALFDAEADADPVITSLPCVLIPPTPAPVRILGNGSTLPRTQRLPTPWRRHNS